MYIENKYWNNYIGDSDDSLNLIAFLEDQSSDEIEFSNILQSLGVNKQGENFRRTVSPLGFTNSMGIYLDFHFGLIGQKTCFANPSKKDNCPLYGVHSRR